LRLVIVVPLPSWPSALYADVVELPADSRARHEVAEAGGADRVAQRRLATSEPQVRVVDRRSGGCMPLKERVPERRRGRDVADEGFDARRRAGVALGADQERPEEGHAARHRAEMVADRSLLERRSGLRRLVTIECRIREGDGGSELRRAPVGDEPVARLIAGREVGPAPFRRDQVAGLAGTLLVDRRAPEFVGGPLPAGVRLLGRERDAIPGPRGFVTLEHIGALSHARVHRVEVRRDAAALAAELFTAAQRRSHLPRDLGGWSGQEFLRIAYQRPGSPDEMAARLQVLVADYAQAGPDAVPEGLKLLMKTLETAVVGGFTVMVLKPNAGFEVEPIPIIEIGGLSGGARATAAVALMMMIAEMRSARRAASPCRVGPLILDNPFGSASALFLVDTQRKVAEASGIQLICTTGLLDPAIRPFRRHIGLSNSRAKGTHLRYVRADETILAILRGEAESERIRGTSVIRTQIPAPIA
jgi:hypothetical protein